MGKDKKEREAQFAIAWVDKETNAQVLVYLWATDDGLFYVQHMMMTPDLRLSYALKFEDNDETTGEFRAWDYFESVRSDQAEARESITNSLREAIKEAS